MKLCFNLKENLSCEKICYQIQKLINKQSNLNKDNSLLVIEIVNIQQDVDTFIPRLDYKEDTDIVSPS